MELLLWLEQLYLWRLQRKEKDMSWLTDIFKSKEELVEQVVELLHDDDTWDEADRQSTRDYYKDNSAADLAEIARQIKRESRR